VYGTRTTPSPNKLDLHFGPNYTCLHLQRLQHYRANEILLTQQYIHTYKHLSRCLRPLIWWSAPQDMSPELLFGLFTYTHRQTNTLETISASAIAVANIYLNMISFLIYQFYLLENQLCNKIKHNSRTARTVQSLIVALKLNKCKLRTSNKHYTYFCE